MEEVIVFQGGGQYFFWMMGIIKYLNNFDLSKIKVVGASAGALSAVLMACHIDVEKALDLALQLCDKHRVWDRRLKFIGVWGGLVEEWLDALLPENAAGLCSHKVYIIVSQLFRTRKIVSTFSGKQELIGCLMASIHIPFLLDYHPFRWFDGWLCYDGCFSIFNIETYKIFGTKDHNYYFFNCHDDDQNNIGSILSYWPRKKDDAYKFIENGFQYTKRLDEQNKLFSKNNPDKSLF